MAACYNSKKLWDQSYTAALQTCSYSIDRLRNDLKVGDVANLSADCHQLILEHVGLLLENGASSLLHMCLVYRPEVVDMAATMLQVAEQMPHSSESR